MNYQESECKKLNDCLEWEKFVEKKHLRSVVSC